MDGSSPNDPVAVSAESEISKMSGKNDRSQEKQILLEVLINCF